jgi:hypothetical protein
MSLVLRFVALGITIPVAASAQVDTAVVRTDTVPCVGQVISSINLSAFPPAAIHRSGSQLRRLMLRVLFQSATTEEDVARSFLFVREGQRCNARRVAEAARILRAQPFLGSASIRTFADTGSTVHLEVETLDEIPLVIGGRWRDGVAGVTFGNANVAGEGVYAVGKWGEGGVYRDALTLQLRKYGIFGQPLVATLDAEQRTLGHSLSLTLSRPYFSNIQRYGWHAGFYQNDTYHPFRVPESSTLSLEVDRLQASAGIVARIGGAGVGLLAGPVVMYERVTPANDAVVITDSGLTLPPPTALLGRYSEVSTFRAGAVLGLRLLSYARVAGFDALVGEQDIARGIQIGVVGARGLEAFGAEDLEDFGSLDVYAGVGGGRALLAVRGKVEGQRPRDAGGSMDEWSSIIAAGRAALYFKPSERRTWTLSAEYSGAWRERTPLQLSLGEKGGGPRGYEGSSLPGGRRVVARFEERRAVGAMGRYMHWGYAWFADAARVWSGSAPFGEDLNIRGSVGIAFLAAIPANSRRLLRADVSVPVTGDASKSWRVTVSAIDATRFFFREPGDVRRSRSISLPASIFGWP